VSKTYRYGPWIGLLAACAVAFTSLLFASGDDPISSGLIGLARWLLGGLMILFIVGFAFEIRDALKSSEPTEKYGSGD
jgi:hypothetical protein